MIGRAVAWTVFAGSVAAATLAPATPSSVASATETPYRIVSADFHVHAFPGDGSMPPWEIRREAARRGLDVVAATNHNQMYVGALDRRLFSAPEHPVLFIGQELTTPTLHVIAIGIRQPIDWRLPIADAIRAIHAQGGVAIGAHPAGDDWQRTDDETLASFDGLEIAHPARIMDATARAGMDAVFARARRLKPAIAPIGSSDYHFGAPIGWSRTRLFVRELSAGGVLEAIRAGRTVAYDPTGAAFGDPQWIAAAGSAAPDVKPSSHRFHHATMALAWCSLVFLIVFGRRRNFS